MKKLIFIFSVFVTVLIHSGFAQPGSPPLLFEKCYGSNYNEELGDVIVTKQGNFLLAGSTGCGYDVSTYNWTGITHDGDVWNATGNNPDGWAVMINPDGDTLWTHTYAGMSDEFLYSVDTALDNGFIFGGWSLSWDMGNEYPVNAFSGWIMKTDSSGNIEWTHRIGSSTFCYDVIPTSQGKYLAVGETDCYFDGGYFNPPPPIDSAVNWFATLFTANGDTLWNHCYGTTGDDHISKAIETYDGNFILVGTTSSENDFDVSDTSGDSEGLWILKIDTNGNKIWDKSYFNHYPYSAVSCPSINYTSDSNYILMISMRNYANTTYYSTNCNMKIDNNGDSLWTHYPNQPSGSEIGYIEKTSDGDYIVITGVGRIDTGQYANNSYTYGSADIFIHKFTPSGNELWFSVLGTTGLDWSYYIYELDDGYAVFGEVPKNDGLVTDLHDSIASQLEDGVYDFCYFKIGKYPVSVTTPDTSTSQNEITIYPNPTDNELSVEYAFLDKGQYRLAVFELKGKQLLSKPLTEPFGLVKIKTDNLPQGNYIISVTNNNQPSKISKQFTVVH